MAKTTLGGSEWVMLIAEVLYADFIIFFFFSFYCYYYYYSCCCLFGRFYFDAFNETKKQKTKTKTAHTTIHHQNKC